VSVK